jgi:hypothetical protein
LGHRAAALFLSTHAGFDSGLDARFMFSVYAICVFIILFVFEFVDSAKYCPHLGSKESEHASCQPDRPPSICVAALSSDSSFSRKHLFGWQLNAFGRGIMFALTRLLSDVLIVSDAVTGPP